MNQSGIAATGVDRKHGTCTVFRPGKMRSGEREGSGGRREQTDGHQRTSGKRTSESARERTSKRRWRAIGDERQEPESITPQH